MESFNISVGTLGDKIFLRLFECNSGEVMLCCENPHSNLNRLLFQGYLF